ncbi:DNA-binding MarR family transcriptional regulator [Sporomusa sp. KB1]|nr:DNA-binding MarR family transcriptional regulator [Sporomusa sp. KB1]
MADANIAEIFRDIVRTCVRKLGLLQKADASCCGITVAQCQTLVEIGKSKCLSLNELSELLTLDKSTMSRTVDNLVNAGVVARQIDKEDRRYMKITLTEKGNEMVEVINSNMENYFEQILNSIPEEKHGLVTEALPYLLTAVNNTEMSFIERQICSGIIREEGRCE